MKRFSFGGLYLNFAGLGEEDEGLLRSTYDAKYDRLRELKKRSHPANLFRVNESIAPFAQAPARP